MAKKSYFVFFSNVANSCSWLGTIQSFHAKCNVDFTMGQ
jgi:hypothetical protein